MNKIRFDHYLEHKNYYQLLSMVFRRGQLTTEAVSQKYFLMCLFIGLIRAYNLVDLSILESKLIVIGINKNIVYNIIPLFHKHFFLHEIITKHHMN